MSKIELVLADLDGTIVDPDSDDVSEVVISSINSVKNIGIKVCAVTGRPFWQAKKLITILGLQEPCIFEGGAVIASPVNGEKLWSRYLTAEKTVLVVKKLLDQAYEIEFDRGVLTPNQVDISQINNPCLSVWASVPAELGEKIIEDLKKIPDLAVHGNPSPGGDQNKWGIHVTDLRADKEHAVLELLKILGVNKTHTMGIGDGNNDIPLFNSSNLRIAMGNGTEMLKASADYIVDSVEEDGFAQAMKRFILNE